MIAFGCMIIFGLAFLASAAAYYWSSAPPTPDPTAVAQLAELGWAVRPENNTIRFELSGRPLPSMERSAELFKRLDVPFGIQLQSLSSINGLHYLRDNDKFESLGISAGTFTDLSEITDFINLKELNISQTPIDGRSAVDSSPLANLKNLRKLNLYATKIMSLPRFDGFVDLRELFLRDTWVSDLSPVSSLPALENLDVTDIRSTDLSPISNNKKLIELGLGTEQIPSLVNLTNLEHLKKLRIISQRDIDLNPVGFIVRLGRFMDLGGSDSI